MEDALQWLGEDLHRVCELTLKYLQDSLDNKELAQNSAGLGVESRALVLILIDIGKLFVALAGNQIVEAPLKVRDFFFLHEEELRCALSHSSLHRPLGSDFLKLD